MKPGLSSPAAFRFCSCDHLSYSPDHCNMKSIICKCAFVFYLISIKHLISIIFCYTLFKTIQLRRSYPMIKQNSIEEFLISLSSKSPIPGGGGACALGGAIGSSLGSMVGNLTLGKKNISLCKKISKFF